MSVMPDEATVRLAFQAVAEMDYIDLDPETEGEARLVVIDGDALMPRGQAEALAACLDWAAPSEAGRRV